MDFEKDVDWDMIAAGISPAKDTRFTCGPMSQFDYFFEKAFVAAANRSLSSDIHNLLAAQLREHFEVRCRTINFAAKQHGLSFEEAFIRLATDQSLAGN
ncbi:hypothetical protein [Okeania sp. SIO2B3]|uniref:hypothetical protein n=1 Tax=Okeania sp. SIO2B3 TaxID=2607784 RepID=UPI0013C221E9|nr:hypothetical protein [Okeania sp. SIO2B3]NET46493.1 hypothetical protein [Okeania sp. SIO2B3]